jgi:3-deoxy-D-manno-octulosonic-acid transferase
MATKIPLLVHAYASASRLLYPFVHPWLARRQKRGKEDTARLPERKGISSLKRPDGLLIWLHGASVGEVVSLLPVAEHFVAKGVHVLVTSGTVTSAEVASRRLPKCAFHQYVPLDLPAYVKRFLDHWKPDIGVFAESELWPNLIHAAHERSVHLVIVNARMSQRSFKRWQKFPSFITSMLSRFELVLAQSEADADRVRALGAPRVQAIGNLKYDVTPPPADPAKLAELIEAIKGRTVFVAASTHPGEEEHIAAAHALAKSSIPSLLTILIPRHPERGTDVASLIFKAGLSVSRRAEGTLPDAHTDIYVADTIGELGLFYRLGSLVYLGGSLVPKGGQNPIEPAKLENGILHGPHVHNFTEVYKALSQKHGALVVADASALAKTIVRLLTDQNLLGKMADAAFSQVSEMSGANQRTIDALEPFLVQCHLDRRGQMSNPK